MQIQKWLWLLLSRWGVLTAGAVLGALLGAIAVARTPVVYEAASTVLLTPPPDQSAMFNAAAVRTLIGNHTIAAEVVQELERSGRAHGMTTQTFLSEALAVEPIPNTQLFQVRVRLRDAQLAATAATRVSERAVELMSRLWRETAAGKRTQLERQMEQARLAMVHAEQRLASYLQSGGRNATVRSGAARSPVSAAGARAMVYSTDPELGELESDVEIRRRVYIDLAARHEHARIELDSTTPPLRLIDPAAVPDEPLPRARGRTIAIGLLAGLVLAACLIVAREWRLPAQGTFGDTRPS